MSVATAKEILKVDIDQLNKAIEEFPQVVPIGSDLRKLQYLIEEGVRLVGLTWNNNNALADSITEENPKGLTLFGRQVV
ncbi:hypothetical protein DDJ69_31280, partial [Klebsiella oxytoca]